MFKSIVWSGPLEIPGDLCVLTQYSSRSGSLSAYTCPPASGRPRGERARLRIDRPSSPEMESTLSLLERARSGDQQALDRLLQRNFIPLRRWASTRLPRWARTLLDTDDLVQDALLSTLARIHLFEPRGVGALQAYLRRAVLNRIQDEVRRTHSRTSPVSIDGTEVDPGASPFEEAVGSEMAVLYEAALVRLRPEDREAIVARVELGFPWQEVAEALGKPSVEAAQMAVSRALVKLAREMGHGR